MKTCIICNTENNAKSVEHIIPESFGNKRYIMEKGIICDSCNSRFSKFEQKALSNSIFVMERARLGVSTKKGKTSKGKIGELIIEGDDNFRKQIINIKGLNKDNIKDISSDNKTFTVTIKSFDKSEVATSKFLLMLGIESIYESRIDTYNNYNFSKLKDYLTNKTNKNWGFITNQNNPLTFIDIPKGHMNKYLRSIHCQLRFNEDYENELLFNFKFGDIGMTINLLNRDLRWVEDYKNKYDHMNIYPSNMEKEYQKQIKE